MTETLPVLEKTYLLLLNRLPGFGYAKLKRLQLLESNVSAWFVGTKPSYALRKQLSNWDIPENFDWQGVEQDLNFAEKSRQQMVTLGDSNYPKLLAQIASPPLVLFVKGNLRALNKPALAMVGSRHPTPQGQDHAFHFGYDLAKRGLSVISGLAMGIDGCSHRGALAAKGSTVAVLGQGLPKVYPKAHQALAEKIVSEQGALVSEFPTHTPVKRSHFPRRNRIISGLSLGVLVVEAAPKSGSLISAQCALEQGRDVFALPGSIHNPLAKGCHHLIRQGALCVETTSHIVEALGFGQVLKESETVATTFNQKEALSSPHKHILSQIGYECTPLDRVVERTGLASQKLLSVLTELELAGKVAKLTGGYIRTE